MQSLKQRQKTKISSDQKSASENLKTLSVFRFFRRDFPYDGKSGFTLFEILITVSVVLVITGIVFYSLSSFRNNTTLQKSISEAKSILEEARSLSISGKSDSSYSVHVEAGGLIRFKGSVYNPSDVENSAQYFTNNNSTIDNISLNGGGTNIIFNKITGTTDTYGTFRIKMINDPNQNITIRVTSAGTTNEE